MRRALSAYRPGLGAGLVVLAIALAIAYLPLTWLVFAGLGTAVVAVTLVEPRLGVLLLVPAIPFGSLRQISVGGVNAGAAEALLALVLVAWLARGVSRRALRWVWPPLALPLGLFVGVLLLSALAATSLRESLKEIVKWVEVSLLYVLVANEFARAPRQRWLRLLVGVVLATGALVAVHGIYQFLFQVGPEPFVLFGRFMRAYGTFEQPNPYAGYLGLTLPLSLGLVAAGFLPAGGTRVRGTWLVWATGCGVFLLAALIMSWSRGGWLGFAAAVAAMMLAVVLRSRRGAILALAVITLVAGGLLAGGLERVPPSVAQRFDDFLPYLGVTDVRGREVTDANFAVLERVAHWQSALEMWGEHPWLGVGAGNYEVVYDRYALPLWPLPLGHAHNYYLNIAAEAGILGLGTYLLLWLAALVAAWRATRRTAGWSWGVALGVLGVLVHLSVHNVFDNLYVHGMYLHVAILLGILCPLGTLPSVTGRSDDLGSNLDGI